MPENKKRKYDEMNKKPDLIIKPVETLPCQCCGDQVKEYKICTGHIVYCSEACREVLILSRKDGYLDQNIKETKTFFEELDKMDDIK